MIDEGLDKKIRMIQAKLILDSNGAVSYSGVINKLLRKTLKK